MIWSNALGTNPAFVDGERQAQFDIGQYRLSLDRTAHARDQFGIMVEVGDVDDARKRLEKTGLLPSNIRWVPHERPFTVAMSDGVTMPIMAPEKPVAWLSSCNAYDKRLTAIPLATRPRVPVVYNGTEA